MKYLKEYYNYDNEVLKICRRYGIRDWSIHVHDGVVDVDGDVDLSGRRLAKLPLKFGIVSSDFDCRSNKLTTLEGSPSEVGGSFYCSMNDLTTLEGGPEVVGGGFYCGSNRLTTLEGSPSEVGGGFYCSNNQLTTLKGGPVEVSEWFECSNNKLTTLEYFPRVRGNIYSDVNSLPKEIKDNIYHLKKIIEWQDEYDIWRDGKLYLPRFRDLMIDIKEGL